MIRFEGSAGYKKKVYFLLNFKTFTNIKNLIKGQYQYTKCT